MPAQRPRDSVDDLLGEIEQEFPSIDLDTEAAVDRIHMIAKHLDRQTDATAERFGLKRGEYKVLLKLRFAPSACLSPGDLAERLLVSTGGMTNRLDRLEAAGFVKRSPDPDDRRGLDITLTDSGREVIDRAIDAQAAEEAAVLSVLAPKDRARLNDLLRALMLAFERPGA